MWTTPPLACSQTTVTVENSRSSPSPNSLLAVVCMAPARGVMHTTPQGALQGTRGTRWSPSPPCPSLRWASRQKARSTRARSRRRALRRATAACRSASERSESVRFQLSKRKRLHVVPPGVMRAIRCFPRRCCLADDLDRHVQDLCHLEDRVGPAALRGGEVVRGAAPELVLET